VLSRHRYVRAQTNRQRID